MTAIIAGSLLSSVVGIVHLAHAEPLCLDQYPDYYPWAWCYAREVPYDPGKLWVPDSGRVTLSYYWTNYPYFYIGDFYPGSEVWNWGNKPYIPGFVTHMTWHSFKWATDYFGPGDCYTISAVVSPGNYWTDLPNVYQYNKHANGPACPPASMFFYNETRLIGQPQPNTSYSGSVWFYKTYPYTDGKIVVDSTGSWPWEDRPYGGFLWDITGDPNNPLRDGAITPFITAP